MKHKQTIYFLQQLKQIYTVFGKQLTSKSGPILFQQQVTQGNIRYVKIPTNLF